jgi:hypothetical protein
MKLMERFSQVGMLAALAQGVPPAPPIRPLPVKEDVGSIQEFILKIIGWLLFFGAVIAVVYLIWAGYQYITAGGDPEKATKAKTAIINAIIGIVVIILSYAILNAVRRAVEGV